MKKILAALLAVSAAGPSLAAVITFQDRASFLAASKDVVTEDFETQALGGQQAGFASTGFHVPTSSNDAPFVVGSPPSDAKYTLGSGQALLGFGNDGLTFVLDGGWTAFAVDFGALNKNGGTALVSGDAGNFTVSLPIGYYASSFFGIISDAPLTSLTFGGDYLLFDNVSVGFAADVNSGPGSTSPSAVPEPAMLGLFGLGAIGLALSRRRKA